MLKSACVCLCPPDYLQAPRGAEFNSYVLYRDLESVFLLVVYDL